jgi:hypothetical protein
MIEARFYFLEDGSLPFVSTSRHVAHISHGRSNMSGELVGDTKPLHAAKPARPRPLGTFTRHDTPAFITHIFSTRLDSRNSSVLDLSYLR